MSPWWICLSKSIFGGHGDLVVPEELSALVSNSVREAGCRLHVHAIVVVTQPQLVKILEGLW